MLSFRQINYDYATEDGQMTPALRDFSLDIKEGEFVAVVGPSGCGKSTLLNLACGALRLTSEHPQGCGEIFLDGHQVNNVVEQGIGYVVQGDMLLPWKTVFENVALALRLQHYSKEDIRRRTNLWLEKVGLKDFSDRYPSELSGGMRKRVAIAGTLVYEPKLVLMDEPFSALDIQTRQKLQDELLALWDELRSTVLFVTHDLEEAIVLADKVIVLTARPATVKRVYDINLSRPRTYSDLRQSTAFYEIYRSLWTDLKVEVELAQRM